MSTDNRLSDTINRKIIANALLTSKHNALPIAATCRYRNPPVMGMQIPCRNPINTAMIDLAINTVQSLHRHVPSGLCIDSDGVLTSPGFQNAVGYLADCMLCDAHQNKNNKAALMNIYFLAITACTRSELQTSEALAEKATSSYIETIYNSIGRTPRTSAERNGQSGFSARAGTKRGAPRSFTGDGSPENPNTDQTRGQGRHRRHPPGSRGGRGHRPNPYAEPPPKMRNVHMPDNVSSGAWTHALARYQQAWSDEEALAASIASQPTTPLTEILAFPTLTGKAVEVDDTSVLGFYAAAKIAAPENAARFFRDEILRWHPDRIDLKFTGCYGKDEVKLVAQTVFRMANQALDESRMAQ